LVMSTLSSCRSLDREGVNRSAHLFAEHAVDQLVLLDPAQHVEAARDDLRAEVVAPAPEVPPAPTAPARAASILSLSRSTLGTPKKIAPPRAGLCSSLNPLLS
jgi:non-ribosomal peptide synthetase component E (peptide arylation enzyme)